jgi:hypothetical protein
VLIHSRFLIFFADFPQLERSEQKKVEKKPVKKRRTATGDQIGSPPRVDESLQAELELFEMEDKLQREKPTCQVTSEGKAPFFVIHGNFSKNLK